MNKKSLGFIIKLTLSLGLLFFLVLGKDVNVKDVTRYWADADKRWLVLSVFVYVGSIWILSYRWNITLIKQGIQLPLKNLFGIYLIGFYFNNFLPSSAGGDLMRVYYAAGGTKNKIGAFSSVFVERLVGFFTIIFLALISTLLLDFFAYKNYVLGFVAGLNLFFISLIIFVFYENILVTIKNWIKNIQVLNVGEIFSRFLKSTSLFENPGKMLGSLFLVSLLYQFSMILFCFLVSQALHVDVPFVRFWVFVPIVASASMVPIFINAIGIREVMWIYLLNLAGKSEELAISLSLLTYFVGLLVSLIGGVLFVMYKREKGQESIA